MPFLSDPPVAELLELAVLHRVCRECGRQTAQDYCRSCDEFYWIHKPGCPMHEDKHYGHRLTIVPFIEDRGSIPLCTAENECIFFKNGNTAVLLNGRQQPELQRAWLELYAEFLESRGQDPAAFRLLTPQGTARFFRTTEGRWNWRFS